MIRVSGSIYLFLLDFWASTFHETPETTGNKETRGFCPHINTAITQPRQPSMPVILQQGDCLDVLRLLSEGSVDSIVTDPPYGLSFLGKKWDHDVPSVEVWREAIRVLKPGGHLLSFSGTRTYHRMVVAIEDAGFEVRDQIGWLYGSGLTKSHNLQGSFEGWGTALKPSWEPICVARKPFFGTVAANMALHGTGALNIARCRVDVSSDAFDKLLDQPIGRWPANTIHDGSDQVEAAFAAFGNAPGQSGAVTGREPSSKTKNAFGTFQGRSASQPRGDVGTASRFFYCARASKADRQGSNHPTIKPINLLRYLCRLVTPPGGIVLDPFAGSGTTGQAAVEEGFNAILIEREDEYCRDIRHRLALYLEN